MNLEFVIFSPLYYTIKNYSFSTKIASIFQKFLLCLWDNTMNAWAAICLCAFINSLTHFLFSKSINGMPI